jgi:hypothetical protein
MRDYGNVSPKFWTGDTGKKIRACGQAAQILALYLITAPGANMIGLYYLPLPIIAHETGLTTSQVEAAFTQLCDLQFAEYDHEAEVVWVRKMAAYQIGSSLKPNDKRIAWIKRELKRYESSRLTLKFIGRYHAAFHIECSAEDEQEAIGQIQQWVADDADAASKPLTKDEPRGDTPSKGLQRGTIQGQGHNRDRDTRQEQGGAGGPGGPLAAGAARSVSTATEDEEGDLPY